MIRGFVILAGTLAMASCAAPTETAATSAPAPTIYRTDEYTVSQISVFTDPATGCEYLVYDGYRQGGITPRLRMDGKPKCGAAQ